MGSEASAGQGEAAEAGDLRIGGTTPAPQLPAAWSGHGRLPLLLAGYLPLSLLFCGRGADWTHGLLTSAGGGDAWSFVWFLNWWPWAILHGHDALRSGFVYAPGGYNLTWATAVPTAALLALPVTLGLGANVSFNLLTALAPGLDGFCACLLVRRCGGGAGASLLGGLLFGFSPYEAGQLQGHLNLDLTMPVPLACLLAVARARGSLDAPRFIGGLVLVLLAEFGLSVEVFATLCSFGAGAWLLFVALARPPDRPALLRLGRDGLAALAVTAAVASPWLAAMAAGASRIDGFVNPPWLYSTNLLNLVVPTRLTWLGGRLLSPVSASFSGNASEQGGYLGLPLLLLLGLLARERGRHRAVPALLALTAALALASLGPSLHVGRWDSRLPLPWWPALHLPLLKAAMPARFSLYVALAAAVAAGLWQAGATTRRGRRQRLAALAVAVLAVMPAPSAVRWRPMPLLPFFQPERVHASLGADATVLVLPYLAGMRGPTPAMLWQWQSGMGFRQTGGALSFLPAPDRRLAVVWQLADGVPGASFGNDVVAYLARAGAGAVVAGPGTTPALLAALRALGWPEQDGGGVTLFCVPPAATLRYAALSGDIWPAFGAWSWMGRSALVATHGRSAVLHVSGVGLPMPATTVTVRPERGPDIAYRIGAGGKLDIPLAADGRYRIIPGTTFAPRIAWKNSDSRTLSFAVSLEPH